MNFATPLYSSLSCPPSTQSVAPPMMEFCGAAAALVSTGSMVWPKLNFAWDLIEP